MMNFVRFLGFVGLEKDILVLFGILFIIYLFVKGLECILFKYLLF